MQSCPACQAPATGKFCSSCGAALGGATCANCRAPLSPGASFCHRCGTPAGAAASPVTSTSPTGFGGALPWAVAAIALVALIALVAGQQFAGRNSAPPSQAAAPLGRSTVDIANMSPEERAERLYDRVMSYSERGRQDSVQFFAPMALAAYSMLGQLTLDQRYDMGRLAAVSGDPATAAAQADTILQLHPDHLLGLFLASEAASMRNNDAQARTFLKQLAAAAPAERAKNLPEYTQHSNDIEVALAAAALVSGPAGTSTAPTTR